MKKIKSLTLLVLFGFAAVGLSISSARADVILNVDGGGNLVGAQHVDVDGTLYDVGFSDGRCTLLFGGCDGPEDFIFSEAGALVAAQAIVDQVFIDSEEVGFFDTFPELTRGCEDTGLCEAMIPFAFGVLPNYVRKLSCFRWFRPQRQGFVVCSGGPVRLIRCCCRGQNRIERPHLSRSPWNGYLLEHHWH